MFAAVAIGRLVRFASRLTRHGGSALPGKVVERIDPGFLARTLGRLPYGVVLVSGTNGKTTTTRMVASMLTDLGLKVFTNPTGSNFTRGVVSALLTQVSLGGRLDADIAVLELDEAYAVHFVRQVRPRYALLLNVMRDQLDRFGEIDNTARLLGHVAEATTGTVVLNREDPRIAALAKLAPEGTEVRYFGLADDLKRFFPSDDDMATTVATEERAEAQDAGAAAGAPLSPSVDGQLPSGRGAETAGLSVDGQLPSGKGAEVGAVGSPLGGELSVQPTEGSAEGSGRDDSDAPVLPADVTLAAVGDHEATFLMDGAEHRAKVRLEGVYNLYNAAAALAVTRAVRPDATPDELVRAAGNVTPAFGRGEIIDVNGSPVELLLVKNPMGFRLALASFDASQATTMIAINDEYADGRDMSWLWDVDFTSLREGGVAMVSGVRAWDMALRLEYDQVPVGAVETDLDKAVERFVTEPGPLGRPRHIYCTYTAMLRARAALGRITDVSDAGVGR
ncbi:glutamate ligase [Bifidobacterium sp. DSM 109958]|uniref:Lipid II isoglutaminyl synthase (glutamine-hydrolyzing) subunit MurT n=1 Tax=Bifidobacterium moraviense TaxID=2675323 RepID=A0A7Y0F1Z1_9BIFI|nr:MurT ligase domain-containing protein [Bifidobacterium sp. DSM 109958]NMN00555.1 glutamate ligase [Bifidobacterium sp. DSM 109958]